VLAGTVCRVEAVGEGKVITCRRVPNWWQLLDRERLVVVEPFGQVVAVLALVGEVDVAAAHLSCLEVRGDRR
jgi:hypothetical protein